MSDTMGKRSTSKRELWAQRVERWRQSGLSMRAYSYQEKISLNGLRYWKAKETEPREKTRAVKLSIPVAELNPRAVIEVVGGERFRIRVPQGFQSKELERVVRSLESVR